jgi:uncharacterized protein (TIGR03000 family)
MFRKQFLASTILSLACALLIADTAQAQRLGIFRGRRGGVSAGYVDGNSGYDGRYGNYGYGDGRYGNNWYSDGWYGNRNYGPGYSGYSGPNYGYSPNYTYSDYYTPSQQQTYSQQQGWMNQNIIRLRVIAPDPQARIFFDGAPTQQTGTERLYYTAPLQTTATNSYRVRATWTEGGKEMSQERDVSVTPGRVTFVDFTQQQGEQIPRGPQQPQPLPQDTILEGKIVRTAQDQVVIQTRDNREVTVYTNPETRYLRNKNPAVFTDLRAGTNVNVDFRMDGKRHIGNTITIRP